MGDPLGAGCIETADLDEIGVVLRDIELQQLSPGKFLARKDFTVFDGLVCYRDRWNRKILGRGLVPHGYFLFACASSPSVHVDWCSRAVDAGHLAFGAPRSDAQFSTTETTDHVVLLVPEGIVRSYLRDAPERKLVSGCGSIACDPKHGRQLIERIDSILDGCLVQPRMLDDTAVRRRLEGEAIGALFACLDDGAAGGKTSSRARRRAALRCAIEHAEGVQGKTTVPELAIVAGVAQRTLELAFRETLGVAPNQYLRRRRMNGARQDLRNAMPGATTVGRVATAWDFTEFGRFAGEYRAMFGELPSETLRAERPVGPRETVLSRAVRRPPRPSTGVGSPDGTCSPGSDP